MIYWNININYVFIFTGYTIWKQIQGDNNINDIIGIDEESVNGQ